MLFFSTFYSSKNPEKKQVYKKMLRSKTVFNIDKISYFLRIKSVY